MQDSQNQGQQPPADKNAQVGQQEAERHRFEGEQQAQRQAPPPDEPGEEAEEREQGEGYRVGYPVLFNSTRAAHALDGKEAAAIITELKDDGKVNLTVFPSHRQPLLVADVPYEGTQGEGDCYFSTLH